MPRMPWSKETTEEDLLFFPRHCRPLVLPHHPLQATLLNAREEIEAERGTGRRTERGVYLNAISIAWLETHTLGMVP